VHDLESGIKTQRVAVVGRRAEGKRVRVVDREGQLIGQL